MTYDELVEDLLAWVDDRAPKVVAKVPRCIRLAEDTIHAELDLRVFHVSKRATFDGSPNGIAIPEDFLGIDYVYVQGDDGMVPVVGCEREYLFDYDPTGELAGTPVHYAFEGEDRLVFSPVPPFGMPYVLGYERRIPRLSKAVQTNWLSLNQEALLFAACLMKLGGFLDDDRKDSIIATAQADYERLSAGVARKDAASVIDKSKGQESKYPPAQATAQG